MNIDTNTFITLSFILSFGAPMLYAMHELRLTRRGERGGGGGGSAISAPTPGPLPNGDDDLPPLPPELVRAVTDVSAPRPRVRETV